VPGALSATVEPSSSSGMASPDRRYAGESLYQLRTGAREIGDPVAAVVRIPQSSGTNASAQADSRSVLVSL